MGNCLGAAAGAAVGGGEETLFFPDEKLPCRHFNSAKGCRRQNCNFAHGQTSLSRFLGHIKAAQNTMDICVFSITCNDIANEIVAAHQRGVRVRVITDDDQMKSRGSDIADLIAKGIPVRNDNSPFHMHHKFVIIDSRVLMNGSFNWTRQAVLNNRENVVVSRSGTLVYAFQAEFQKMWDLYA
mmetsp:Transcript_14011/g.55235  ORF Transcript_14011/g.55235 Transcript_14011/m.55235 type:complete len:183 (-) Transcript_14011:36-584(-)